MEPRCRGRDPADLPRAAGSASSRTRRWGAASCRAASPRLTSWTPATSAASGPRFTGDNLDANLTLAGKVAEIAEYKGCTPAQLALAWVLAQGDDVVPIPGTKRRKYLEQNAGAVDVELTTEDLARIDAEVPRPAGDRYDETGMAAVNL